MTISAGKISSLFFLPCLSVSTNGFAIVLPLSTAKINGRKSFIFAVLHHLYVD